MDRRVTPPTQAGYVTHLVSPGVPLFHLKGPLETNRASSTVDKSAKGHYPCLAADLFF